MVLPTVDDRINMTFFSKISIILISLSFFWGCRTQRKMNGYNVAECVRGKKTVKCSAINDLSGLYVNEGELGDEQMYDSVRLILNHGLKKFCSGVFVKKNIMIAPAQCFLANNKSHKQIFLVKINSLSKEKDLRLRIVDVPRKVVINPAYKQAVELYGAHSIKSLSFDLAVVVFRKPIVSKNQVFELMSQPVTSSSSLAWVGHGLPGIWASTDLWRRRSQVKIADSKFDSDLIEVDYTLRVTEQMQADRANLPASSGSVLLSGRKVIGHFVGFSFQRFAFIFETNKRIFFTSFTHPVNRDFLNKAISDNVIIQGS